MKPKHELTTHADHVSSQLWSTNIPIAEESLIICKHSARASHGVLSTPMEEGGLFSGEVCQQTMYTDNTGRKQHQATSWFSIPQAPLIITDPPHRMHDVRGTTWNKPKSRWLLPGSRTKKQLRMDFISLIPEKSQKKSQKNPLMMNKTN